MSTALVVVASGAREEWVIRGQIVAIVIWAGAVAAAASGLVALIGW